MDTMTSVRAAECGVLAARDNDELAHHAAVLVLEDVAVEHWPISGQTSGQSVYRNVST
jgi:hypothetical protein